MTNKDAPIMTSSTAIAVISLGLVLSACGQNPATPARTETQPEATATALEVSVPVSPATYTDAVAATNRLEGDYARDAGRKPAEVLQILEVMPGQTVLDLFSGGGYYTEIIANIVGEEGRVVAHSNAAYLNFVGDEFNARYADGRLSNVEVLMAENNELQLEAGQFDAITLVLSYHDAYYADAERGWPAIDVPKLLAELRKGLKDDGVIGIVDHYAATGASSESGGTVHRIDPAVVIADMEAAGFYCDAKSDLLRNLADDYSVIVFDPAVRGKTDRFILRFRKSDQD